MYAVFANKAIIYLGNDQDRAVGTLESKRESDPDATLSVPETLDGLYRAYQSYLVSSATDEEFWQDVDEGVDEVVEGLSDAASKVLEKLDEAGFNAENVEGFSQRLKDNTDKAVAEVRGLGLRSVKAVGEGFIALGDLLKEVVDEEPQGDEDAEDPPF